MRIPSGMTIKSLSHSSGKKEKKQRVALTSENAVRDDHQVFPTLFPSGDWHAAHGAQRNLRGRGIRV
jgi:hypothetical protein